MRVPLTHYGVAISLMNGVLPRSLQIFPEALLAYQKAVTNFEPGEHHESTNCNGKGFL